MTPRICLMIPTLAAMPRGGSRVSFTRSSSESAAMYADKILKGAQPGRSSHRAAYEVRAGHHPQARQGPSPYDPALAAGAGGSGHRVVNRRRFLLTSLAGALAGRLAAEAQQPATQSLDGSAADHGRTLSIVCRGY